MILKNKYVIYSIDFEAWFQIENLVQLRNDNSLFKKSLLEEQLDLLLNFLSLNNIKATFFILGSVATRFKSLIRKIVENGHEISSHGSSHRLNYEFSFKELKCDIKQSKEILEDISQTEIIGYRAPCFSIEERLFEILNELNFKYDSSLNISSLNSKYGDLPENYFDKINPFYLEKYNLIEYPLPVFQINKFYFPISGGGFGRLTPRILWKILIKEFFKKYDYLILYLHPWEIDPNIPKIRTNIRKDFANYYGINRYLDKFEYLYKELKEFTNWCSFKDILNKKHSNIYKKYIL